MRLLLVLVLGLVFGGCQIGGIAPLYGSRDKVRDDRIEGVSAREPDPAVDQTVLTTISPLDNGSYSLHCTTEGKQAEGEQERPFELQGTLVTLGGSTYLDVEAPTEALEQALGDYWLFVLPIHYYYRVEWGEDRISLATLDQKWFKELLKTDQGMAVCIRPGWGEPKPGQVGPGAYTLEPPFVLTGSTEAVQDFVARKASRPEAWTKSDTYLKYQSLLPDDDDSR